MKKIIIILISVLILLAGIFFFSKRISNGCGMVPCEYTSKCLGIYIQTFDDRAIDGGVGGRCLGIVKNIKNEKYEEIMNNILGKSTSQPKPKEVDVNKSVIIKRIGERESSFLVQKINEKEVIGLWYEKYPVQDSKGVIRTLYIGDDIGYACEGISETLTNIDFTYQGVSFTKIIKPELKGGCPL